MKFRNLFNLNKGISAPVAITIIIVLAVIVGGGILIWQYFGTPKEEIKGEAADWKTYKNEGYSFEFEYPKEWVSLELKSQENNEIYIFQSSNKSIEKIFYFKPQKMIVFILYGEDYSSICPEWNEIFQVRPRSEILNILYPDKEIKTIYTTKRLTSEGCLEEDFMGNVSLSPNGEYIAFVLHGYEWSNSIIRNINTGEDISGADFYDPYKQVFWSSSSKTLVIISPACEMEPCTTQEAVFVSDYGELEKLNKILPLTILNSVDNLYFIDDNKLFFSVGSGGKMIKYEYDVIAKELKEIR